MNRNFSLITFPYRKLRLQMLQLRHLRGNKNHQRYKDQKQVLLLLFITGSLFSMKKMDKAKDPLYKYLNVLIANVRRDDFYKPLIKAMKHDS